MLNIEQLDWRTLLVNCFGFHEDYLNHAARP